LNGGQENITSLGRRQLLRFAYRLHYKAAPAKGVMTHRRRFIGFDYLLTLARKWIKSV